MVLTSKYATSSLCNALFTWSKYSLFEINLIILIAQYLTKITIWSDTWRLTLIPRGMLTGKGLESPNYVTILNYLKSLQAMYKWFKITILLLWFPHKIYCVQYENLAMTRGVVNIQQYGRHNGLFQYKSYSVRISTSSHS